MFSISTIAAPGAFPETSSSFTALKMRNPPSVAVKGLAAGVAREGMAPLASTSPEKLANEVLSNATKWGFVNLAPKLAARPLLVITSDDGLAIPSSALVDAV